MNIVKNTSWLPKHDIVELAILTVSVTVVYQVLSSTLRSHISELKIRILILKNKYEIRGLALKENKDRVKALEKVLEEFLNSDGKTLYRSKVVETAGTNNPLCLFVIEPDMPQYFE